MTDPNRAVNRGRRPACPVCPRPLALLVTGAVLALAGCGDAASAEWAGRVDTLASGQVVVTNPETGVWAEGEGWTLTEEARIGTLDGDGPDMFGQIMSLAVDPAGRVYVLEGQAQEVRVFDADGAHVRTFGRSGGGPGEFGRALRLDLGPDGNIWVADPQNNRLSVFDTAGTYLDGHTMAGGFTIIPWPGRFDDAGRYYYPVPLPSEGEFWIGLSVYDSTMTPVDTLTPPEDPVEREYFEMRQGDNGFFRSSIPFSGGFQTRLSPRGTYWGLVTDEYRLTEFGADGDTIRTTTRPYDPVPVTEADMEQARENLSWFLEQGGEADWSKVPDVKPGARGFAFDDQGNVWVWPVTAGVREGSVLDVFDETGRYLGPVSTSVALALQPAPVFVGDVVYGVTTSELDVPYVVRLRLQR
ncbi:MAG TPA: 6-bladed beta-propeller [Longimicrobiales bacterium]|nr:6-bladed beta-propeller [Longimicrobiales bacterium]